MSKINHQTEQLHAEVDVVAHLPNVTSSSQSEAYERRKCTECDEVLKLEKVKGDISLVFFLASWILWHVTSVRLKQDTVSRCRPYLQTTPAAHLRNRLLP